MNVPEPHLKLIVLKTADVESARAFYQRLGFDFVQEQHGNGPGRHNDFFEQVEQLARICFASIHSQVVDLGGSGG